MLLQNQIERLTSMNKKLRIGLMLLIVALIAMPEALAVPSHLTNFTVKYPFTAGTRIDSCDLCHIPGLPQTIANRNAYGFDFGNQTLRFTDPNQSFVNIELNDSDGDGFTNIVEINALTFPGNASDQPSVLTTINVIPASATVVLNNTTNFTATGRDQLGNAVPVIVTWNSSNITVGTIDAAGIFTALALGTTTITASNGTINGTAIVIVTATAIVRGDVNGNGALDVTDTLFTLQAVAALRTLTAAQTSAADVNGNGVLDITDGLFIAQAVAGLRILV